MRAHQMGRKQATGSAAVTLIIAGLWTDYFLEYLYVFLIFYQKYDLFSRSHSALSFKGLKG